MDENIYNIQQDLINIISPDIEQQYLIYKNRVAILKEKYDKIKEESIEIAKIIKQMRNENIIDNHLSKLFLLMNTEGSIRRKNYNNQQNMNKINDYFQRVQKLSIESLKMIFEIRKFFTGQEFEIYIEEKGKIFSFSIEDIENHADNIIPIYTNSLEKFINRMENNSRTIAPELNKLGLSLKSLNEDLELKGIQSYLEFVNYHVEKNKLDISENRKLEAAIYLYNRNSNVNFQNQSERHSLHIMLGWYMAHGGLSDTIAMYKLGDAIRKTDEGFKNIEIKMHNGTISLTMIANGIKKLNEAFNSNEVKNKIIKFFGVNIQKLSSPIEKEAENEVIKSIEQVFKNINMSLTN